MKFKTEKQKERAERTAYRAMDALQRLADNGLGCRETDLAMKAVRVVIEKIQSAPIKEVA